MATIVRGLVEKQKGELGEIKFLVPVFPETEGKIAQEEKSQFLPPPEIHENTGCMSGN